MTHITRRIEFDAGHRIPDHAGQCRNVHGHRYVVEATFVGPLKTELGKPDTGMVRDFGDLKKLLQQTIHEPWDHAFLCYDKDEAMRNALASVPDTKFVMLPFVPTAENLAQEILQRLVTACNGGGVQPLRVRLYETPNAYAEASIYDD
jgi:6-pyruvoyltetrahydropterin/6-carboxytetrahydropterin synthase